MHVLGRACALALALLADGSMAGEGEGAYSFSLSGKAFDEHCLKLAAGEAIRYRFRASAPVDFNIHFHRGKDVFYPIRQQGVQAAEGSFRAEAADDYCLMWEHGGEGRVAVEGAVERVPSR
jgi:hypothetical protein